MIQRLQPLLLLPSQVRALGAEAEERKTFLRLISLLCLLQLPPSESVNLSHLLPCHLSPHLRRHGFSSSIDPSCALPAACPCPKPELGLPLQRHMPVTVCRHGPWPAAMVLPTSFPLSLISSLPLFVASSLPSSSSFPLLLFPPPPSLSLQHARPSPSLCCF